MGTPTMARSAFVPCGTSSGRQGRAASLKGGGGPGSSCGRPGAAGAGRAAAGDAGGGVDTPPCHSAWMPPSMQRLLSTYGPPATPRELPCQRDRLVERCRMTP